MKLENTVRIAAAPDRVFAAINDVEHVVTCVPGAALTGRDGDAYQGGITVKVGPIRAAYSGTVEFLNVDTKRHTLVMSGRAADKHGSGDAQAQVTLSVEAVPEGSLLRVESDLVLSGKIVAFGKGAIVTVSNKIMDQFATNLAAQLNGDHAVLQSNSKPVNGITTAASPPLVASVQAPEEAGLDVLSLLPASAVRNLRYALTFLFGVFEGWLISRAFRKV